MGPSQSPCILHIELLLLQGQQGHMVLVGSASDLQLTSPLLAPSR